MLALPDSAARAALDATFAGRAYDRSLRQTLWSRVWSQLVEWFQALRALAVDSPLATWALVALAGAIVAAIVARVVYVDRRRREANAVTRTPRRGAPAEDPWRAATAFAAAGRYTEAAHALYAALLDRLARRDRLRRDPAKTAGDYARELRALGSPAHTPFRRFVRDYDVVVYGLGTCDASRYAQLLSAANAVLPHDA